MSTPVLVTKLSIPRPQSDVVPRPRLIDRLNEGLHHKLTLVSAPARFGKTTLLSAWVEEHPQASTRRSLVWLSLDEGENDPSRFLLHLVAALQVIAAGIGAGVAAALQSSQPPPVDTMLTVLLNEITSLLDPFIVVLDDYHLIDAQPVDDGLTFLLEHLPPQMHLVIATREDPSLPLARFRARGQLTELRATDQRFTPSETAACPKVMGTTILAGPVIDQAALYDVLRKVRDLALPLISVIRVDRGQPEVAPVDADAESNRSNKEVDA